MSNDPFDQPPATAHTNGDVSAGTVPPAPSPDLTAPAPTPHVVAPRTGALRVLSITVMVAGAILVLAGTVTWFVVRDQLAAEKIVVSEDAPFLAGSDVNGPFSAYAEAEAINEHALAASDGLTYAELDSEDPARGTVMTASFLRASLFTSVVAFGVAVFAAGIGVVLILIGWALWRIGRLLQDSGPPAAPA